MMDLPQTKLITLKEYLKEIDSILDNKNYLAALIMCLSVPDICSNYLGLKKKNGFGYKKWFNDYVYKYMEVSQDDVKKLYKGRIPKTYELRFNGKKCYALRCSLIHEGTVPVDIKKIKGNNITRINATEMCVNSKSDKYNQYGEAKRIINSDTIEQQTIRINIANLANSIIKGCNDFLANNKIEDIELFLMLDWDNKGNIQFTANN